MAGHVYLIGSRRFSWFKIGKSSNATIRVSELGILLPFRIEIVAVWKSVNHHFLEKELHERFAANRINGEWFSFDHEELNSIIAEMSDHAVKANHGFSNMGKDVLMRHPLTGKIQRRIDSLIKENCSLREQIKALSSSATVQ